MGETLAVATTGVSDDDGLNEVSFTYQWLADDTNIIGATGSTYKLIVQRAGQGHQGHGVLQRRRWQRRGADQRGNGNSGGQAQHGCYWCADYHRYRPGWRDADGGHQRHLRRRRSGRRVLRLPVDSRRWFNRHKHQRSDRQQPTRSLRDDQGKTIKVKVTFNDDAGNAEALTSAPTETVEAESGDSPLWTATMTAAPLYTGYGYSDFDGFRYGSLTTKTFDIDDATYKVNLIEASGWMYIGFDKEMPMKFGLVVDGKRLESKRRIFYVLHLQQDLPLGRCKD